jgi:hypothetical protein
MPTVKMTGRAREFERSQSVRTCGISRRKENSVYRPIVELGRTDFMCSTLERYGKDRAAMNESTAAGIEAFVRMVGIALQAIRRASWVAASTARAMPLTVLALSLEVLTFRR